MIRKGKILTKNQAFLKACSFCAYQERLQSEVRDKLKQQNVAYDVIEEIISDLIQQNFLNEERFAIAYAGGKFRIKKWGRQKIRRALEMKGVSEYCIRKGLSEIPEEDYVHTLKEIIEKMKMKNEGFSPYELKNKVAQYSIGRGYESDVVWNILNEK